MTGIRDFIIEVKEPFKDTISYGDVEIYIEKNISRDRSSNRHGRVISCPFENDNMILSADDEIIFDATILYKQIYKEGIQNSVFLVDEEKSWYRIDPSLIVLYRKQTSDEWRGYKDNLMVEFDKPSSLEKDNSTSIIVRNEKQKKARIIYINDAAEQLGVEKNDSAFVRNEITGVPFFFNEKTLHWIRNKDLLAI